MYEKLVNYAAKQLELDPAEITPDAGGSADHHLQRAGRLHRVEAQLIAISQISKFPCIELSGL